MLLRALGFKPKPAGVAIRAKLPQQHAFIDMALTKGGASGSVCFEDVDAKTFTVTALPELRPGALATFVYANELGKFRFSAKCIAIEGSVATFELPTAVETLQRFDGAKKRSSVRLDTTVPVQWRLAPGGKGSGEFTRGVFADISRTGASLSCDRDLTRGAQVELRFSLNSASAPIEVLGEVMRTTKIERSGKHALGIRFVGVTGADDRAIMEFINRRQAERRSRGLA